MIGSFIILVTMKLQKILIPALALLFFFPLANKASADISGVDCSIYTTNASLFDAAVNQQRFAQDMVTSIVTGPMISSMVGADFATSCKCAQATEANGGTPTGTDCEKVKTFISAGGLFLTTKYALDISEHSKDIIGIKYYARDILENTPFIKTAYAADAPSPLPAILDIWKEMRNLSYIFFTAVFIALGFMIMFRKRIDPQTVVTVQNSLPRVILALVLITFSYPIVAIIFSLSGPLGTLVKNTFANAFGAGQIVNLIVRVVLAAVAGFLISIPAGGLMGLAIGLLLGILFVAIIIALAIIIITFISRLGKVAILTVLAPFIFLMGAMPGNEKTILNWFKNILSLTLQIPALTFILWFGLSIATTLSSLTGVGDMGIFLVSAILNPLIGTFILFQAGKVPKMVDNALGVEPLMFGDNGPKKGKR